MSTPMLRIEEDYTTGEADEWLTGLIVNVFSKLDFETCVGKVDGEAIEDELTYQVEKLTAKEVEGVVGAAILALTSTS